MSSDGKLCKYIDWLEEIEIERYYEFKDGELTVTNNTFNSNKIYNVLNGERYRKIFSHSGWMMFDENYNSLNGLLEQRERVRIISIEKEELVKVQRENGDIVYMVNGAGNF